MRTAPDHRGGRGRGPARVLAALGALLLLAALVVPGLLDARSSGDGAASSTGVGQGRRVLEAAPSARGHAPRDGGAPGQDRPPEPGRASPAPGAGQPVRLDAPVLDVDAPVVGVDLDGGVLVPPSDPGILGWWRSGAVPGAARGTAVIAGHSVHTGGGALDDLSVLRRGDPLRLVTDHGVVHYRVRSVTVYPKSTLSSRAPRLFSQRVPGRLALVTCEDWNGVTWESNTVVLATPTSGSAG